MPTLPSLPRNPKAIRGPRMTRRKASGSLFASPPWTRTVWMCPPSMSRPLISTSSASVHLPPLTKKTSERGSSKSSNARQWLVFGPFLWLSCSVLQIGPHTFHLHEIYGLTTQSSAPAHPHTSSPTSTDVYTYPPTSTTAAPATSHEDEPSSECLVCLSSPREVILLPCRHLVACKECAINMVEFGAGGNIVHNETTNGTATAGAEGEGGSGAANTSGATEGSNPPTVTPPNPRRKRKAKGWFCPVCRQRQCLFLRVSNPTGLI